MSGYLIPEWRMPACDCGETSREPGRHANACALFACSACGSRMGVEHAPDCADRCPHCGSEGQDNDHRDECPTLDTCAQCYPSIPRDEWHPEPPDLKPGDWRKWIDNHLATMHPGVRP